jgi:hypothetical protein
MKVGKKKSKIKKSLYILGYLLELIFKNLAIYTKNNNNNNNKILKLANLDLFSFHQKSFCLG